MTSNITPINTSVGHDYAAIYGAPAGSNPAPSGSNPAPGGGTPVTASPSSPAEQLEHGDPKGRGMRRRLSDALRSPTFSRLFPKSRRSSMPSTPVRDSAARRLEIRAERKAREATLEPTASSEQISQALAHVRDNEDAKLLMFGYSPTGGGHTGRSITILEESLKEGDFNRGDVVVVHVPSVWNNRPRPGQLAALAEDLGKAGVTVLLAEAEKSVQGYLRPDGGSDDPKILERIAMMPKRPDAEISTITQAKIFGGAGDLAEVPTLDANHLMDSVAEILGTENMNKVYVLTDMDPALQKAASRYGVPDHHRVDQQNHPILLDLNEGNLNANLQPHMGVLGKVLGGHREYVAYIGLGQKNTLQDVTRTAERMGLTAETTKEEALHKISASFLEHGQPVDLDVLRSGKGGNGILHHPGIKDAGDVKNMVYVYANDNQAEIAQAIDEKIKADDPDYANTLFVFCGNGAFKPGPGAKGLNALHMAYLADADGITTAGAGTVGEFCYLHKSGGAQSKFMAIPIDGHNEQEANAHFLHTDPELNQHVTIANNLAETPLVDRVKTFVAEAGEYVDAKYAGQNMKSMLDAVGAKDTYPAHGSKLLHGKEEMTADEQQITSIEIQMNKSTVLSANRHFQKLVFQAISDLEPKLRGEPAPPSGIRGSKLGRSFSSTWSGPGSAIAVKLRKADTPKTFKDAKELRNFLMNLPALTSYLADGEKIAPNNIMLLQETQDLFRNIAAKTWTAQDALVKMNALKEKLGHMTTTGF